MGGLVWIPVCPRAAGPRRSSRQWRQLCSWQHPGTAVFSSDAFESKTARQHNTLMELAVVRSHALLSETTQFVQTTHSLACIALRTSLFLKDCVAFTNSVWTCDADWVTQ
eukprot:6832374-Pyramimonas_sp.AAC.1